MKKIIKNTKIVAPIAVVTACLALLVVFAPSALAQTNPLGPLPIDSPTPLTIEELVRRIVNIMLYIIGIISVIMIIFAGIKYATSTGSQEKVTSAKNTLLYAIVGLVVAIFAYAIVNWVYKAVI